MRFWFNQAPAQRWCLSPTSTMLKPSCFKHIMWLSWLKSARAGLSNGRKKISPSESHQWVNNCISSRDHNIQCKASCICAVQGWYFAWVCLFTKQSWDSLISAASPDLWGTGKGCVDILSFKQVCFSLNELGTSFTLQNMPLEIKRTSHIVLGLSSSVSWNPWKSLYR